MRRGWLSKPSFLFARRREFALWGDLLCPRRQSRQNAAGISSEQTTALPPRSAIPSPTPSIALRHLPLTGGVGPRPRGRDESVQHGDLLCRPARCGLRIDFPLAPLPLMVWSLWGAALLRECAGGMTWTGCHPAHGQSNANFSMTERSAAAARAEYQCESRTAPDIRRNHFAQRPRRNSGGPGGQRHCRPRR